MKQILATIAVLSSGFALTLACSAQRVAATEASVGDIGSCILVAEGDDEVAVAQKCGALPEDVRKIWLASRAKLAMARVSTSNSSCPLGSASGKGP